MTVFPYRCFLLALGTLLATGGVTPSPALGQLEVVTVDFAGEMGPATYRASGFMNTMFTEYPAPQWVDPLKPKLFRGFITGGYFRDAGGINDASATYGRLHNHLGAVIQIFLGLPGWGQFVGLGADAYPGDDLDWEPWERYVEEQVLFAQERGYDVQWDIWNEPDEPTFWDPPRLPDGRGANERFQETWIRAVRVIRRLDPDAVIVGPSNSYFKGKRFAVTDFLQQAKYFNVLPDVLAWHEWYVDEIVPHIAEARQYMASHGIPELPISINEYVLHPDQMRPGVLPLYYAAFERMGIVTANRSCWEDPDATWSGGWNCGNLSLNGLLKDNGEPYGPRVPRGVWWATKGYADVTGTLVDVLPGATIDGVAGKDAARKESRMVLGRDLDGSGDATLRLVNLAAAPYLVSPTGAVRIIGQYLRRSGWDEVPAPYDAVDTEVQVVDGAAEIVLPGFHYHYAYLIRLLDPSLGPPENPDLALY